jgi:hypothetical protein
MFVSKGRYTIDFEEWEISALAFALRRELLDIVKTHYNCLQQNQDGEDCFFTNESGKLRLSCALLELLGCGPSARDLEKEVKHLFETKRIERAKQ